MRLLSSCNFRGQGAAPERSRVDPVGIEGEHPVVEIASRCGLAVHPIEIADVSARRVDVAGAAIRVERAMTHDDCLRIDRGEPVDGCEPSLPASPIGLHKERMRFVVNRVTGDQEAKRRDMQRGRLAAGSGIRPRLQQSGGCQQGIVPLVHWRRSGMGRLTTKLHQRAM